MTYDFDRITIGELVAMPQAQQAAYWRALMNQWTGRVGAQMDQECQKDHDEAKANDDWWTK